MKRRECIDEHRQPVPRFQGADESDRNRSRLTGQTCRSFDIESVHIDAVWHDVDSAFVRAEILEIAGNLLRDGDQHVGGAKYSPRDALGNASIDEPAAGGLFLDQGSVDFEK